MVQFTIMDSHYLKTCKGGILEAYRITYDCENPQELGIPILLLQNPED